MKNVDWLFDVLIDIRNFSKTNNLKNTSDAIQDVILELSFETQGKYSEKL